MEQNLTYKIIRALAMPILKIFYRYEINNKNNLPLNGKFIVCPNHISLIDCAFVIVSQKRKINLMAKAELFKNKLLGAFFRSMGAFPVERGKSDRKAITTAEEILKNDGVLGIFIEGTRSKDGNLLKPKSGVALIAYQTQTPVLPICITCQKGGRLRLFKKVIVSCGEPLSLEELGLKNGTGLEFRNASRLIMEKISQMREQDLKI